MTTEVFQADGIPKFRFQKRFLFCKQMGVSENGGGKAKCLDFFSVSQQLLSILESKFSVRNLRLWFVASGFWIKKHSNSYFEVNLPDVRYFSSLICWDFTFDTSFWMPPFCICHRFSFGTWVLAKAFQMLGRPKYWRIKDRISFCGGGGVRCFFNTTTLQRDPWKSLFPPFLYVKLC